MCEDSRRALYRKALCLKEMGRYREAYECTTRYPLISHLVNTTGCSRAVGSSRLFMLIRNTATLKVLLLLQKEFSSFCLLNVLTGQTGERARAGAGCPSRPKDTQALYQHQGQVFDFGNRL